MRRTHACAFKERCRAPRPARVRSRLVAADVRRRFSARKTIQPPARRLRLLRRFLNSPCLVRALSALRLGIRRGIQLHVRESLVVVYMFNSLSDSVFREAVRSSSRTMKWGQLLMTGAVGLSFVFPSRSASAAA